MSKIEMTTNGQIINEKGAFQQWWTFALCWCGGLFAGMDAHLYNLMLPQISQDFLSVNNTGEVGQFGSSGLALFLLGWMGGGILFGIIGDRWGRVVAMALSMFVYALFAGMTAFATEIWQLHVFRLLVGLGIGGQMVSMAVLLAETWSNKGGALALGALITSYQAGVFFSGIVGSSVDGWREAFLVGGFPLAVAVVVWMTLVEPLSQKSIHEEEGPVKNSLLSNKRFRRRLILGILGFGGLLIGYWSTVAWVPSWILEILGGNRNGYETRFATVVHGLAAVVGCCSAGPLVNRFGRVKILSAALIASFILSITMFGIHKEFSSIIYVEYSMLGFFIGLGQGGFYIYLGELFPPSIRATAVGLSLNTGRFFTVIAVLFLGTLVSWFGGTSYALMVFAGAFLLGAFAVMGNDETFVVNSSYE